MTKKVLIVDDEQNIAISVEYLMRREGFDVSVARDGEEGLAMIRSTKPDLVLLDVMMPKMDGFQVCSAVRADAALADVRIIMLTAKGRDAEVAKGLSLGADAYIPKPFSTSDLVSRVNSLMESKK
ncbi:MAG: response regulator [Gammaproteobacteria bacterium]|nr:response regulator [Gammaproteobacteria bacterium]